MFVASQIFAAYVFLLFPLMVVLCSNSYSSTAMCTVNKKLRLCHNSLMRTQLDIEILSLHFDLWGSWLLG